MDVFRLTKSETKYRKIKDKDKYDTEEFHQNGKTKKYMQGK